MRRVELFFSSSNCSVYIIITSIIILSFLSHSYHSSSDHNHYVQPLLNLNSLLKSSFSYHHNDNDDDIEDHRLHRDETITSNELFQNISMSGMYQLKTGDGYWVGDEIKGDDDDGDDDDDDEDSDVDSDDVDDSDGYDRDDNDYSDRYDSDDVRNIASLLYCLGTTIVGICCLDGIVLGGK